jgi:propionyl-CoA carboxylase beta chain
LRDAPADRFPAAVQHAKNPPSADRGRPDASRTSLDTLIPDNPNKPYDMKEADPEDGGRGRLLRDPGSHAKNIVVGFAAWKATRSASSPTSRWCWPAVLDIDASRKAARFVRFCDCFNIPLVTFVDVPGFLPGTAQEYGGLIKHGAKLLFAYAEATVPKVTVITRKAYGGAYDVMSSKHIRAT